jgi:alcohol dehydrogenase class IV
MDALTQLIEPLVSRQANPMSDAICREGIRRAALWLQPAYEDGANIEARTNMSIAGLFGGLALANAGLGAVHGLAAPLGGLIPIPHGVACARLLPQVAAANLKALRLRSPNSPAIVRYEEASRLLVGKPGAHAEEGIEWLFRLCSDLSIPNLSSFGLTDKDFQNIAEKAQKSSSMKGNPVNLEMEELLEILQAAL